MNKHEKNRPNEVELFFESKTPHVEKRVDVVVKSEVLGVLDEEPVRAVEESGSYRVLDRGLEVLLGVESLVPEDDEEDEEKIGGGESEDSSFPEIGEGE